MKDQHEKIMGYRDLSQAEIDAMNVIKGLAAQCGVIIGSLETDQGTDKRCVALAKTNLQQGFMWAVRSIAQPTGF
jgi:hypothetical protein